MDIFTKEEALKKKNLILKRIKAGEVFIYPTDTIYGIGCDATNVVAVNRVRELKLRNSKPFSVIVPSVDWIQKNCEVTSKKWLIKLPGPYTLVLPLKNNKAICAEANMGLNSLGVRIPRHWISNVVESLGFPLITTSVNKGGLPPGSTMDDFKQFDVDFIIYEGENKGVPSTVVDLTKGEKVLR